MVHACPSSIKPSDVAAVDSKTHFQLKAQEIAPALLTGDGKKGGRICIMFNGL